MKMAEKAEKAKAENYIKALACLFKRKKGGKIEKA